MALLTLLLSIPRASNSSEAASRVVAERPSWYAPIIKDGKAFPVVLPADGRWLNWRDTYGAPRMRLEPDGVWRQVGTHQGIDVYAEQGTPVVSISDGVVENIGWTLYSGWRVGVRGSDGRYYFYAHLLQPFAPGIGSGSRVRAGDQLGLLGSSGYGEEGTVDEFPAHLHFGLQAAGGAWLNPQEMLRDLYLHSVSTLREARRAEAELGKRRQSVAARAFGAAPPPHEAIAEQLTLIERETARVRPKFFGGD